MFQFTLEMYTKEKTIYDYKEKGWFTAVLLNVHITKFITILLWCICICNLNKSHFLNFCKDNTSVSNALSIDS